jgi:hypothetical protein
MKRIFKILIWAAILAALIVSFFYLPIEIWFNQSKEALWNQYIFPFIVNIVVYIIRTILLGISKAILKGKTIHFVVSIVINLIWIGFLIWLLTMFNPVYAAAIASFLIVAISLTFRSRINNIVSGAMIILTEGFEPGDLIETSDTQGIVEDVSLNYTRIRQFNGIVSLIPNQIVFNAKVKKFTYRTISSQDEESSEEERSFFERYGDKIFKLISKGEKVTRYIKIIEVRPNIAPKNLEGLLNAVFDKYEPLLGFRPFFYVNQMTFDRCSITLQLVGENPQQILLYVNSFLRDVLYKLYTEEVFKGWEGELPKDLSINDKKFPGGAE